MVERINKTLLYTYGIADLGFVLMVSMELYLFSAFLTDYAEFSVPMTSFILVFTSLADIACALAAGMILQKVTLKYGGKYRSWFLIGPPAVAVLFILQFSKIGQESGYDCAGLVDSGKTWGSCHRSRELKPYYK